jgi:hypothetical protein
MHVVDKLWKGGLDRESGEPGRRRTLRAQNEALLEGSIRQEAGS